MATSSRGKRERFLVDQVVRLEEVFAHTQSPTGAMKEQLAKDLSTTRRRIQVWFQNRRSKSKRRNAKELSAVASGHSPESSHHQHVYHHEMLTDNSVLSSPADASHQSIELATGGITELAPSIIQPRHSHPEMTPTFLYQPSYSIDTACERHQNKYYVHSLYLSHQNQQPVEQLQRPRIIHTLPPLTSTQHQPPPSFYLHDGPSFFENRQNHPTNYVSVIPNPSVSYILSHEGQQSQHHRRHQQQVSSPWSSKQD